jgi:hypothetical protein
MKVLLQIILFGLIFISLSFAQNSSDLVYVDSSGRMRWTANHEESFFFGVNYSTPFAFSYRALKNKGISHKEVIDLDVQQFKRLGLNAYRIHVWDREVSDRDGNLLVNEHIELLDYLISKLIENDIYIILTPIAWWGTGWPEPDIPTPGFSTFYSKIESTTKLEVIKTHTNYLKQFVNHKNSYTGKTYKDEDHIIAFEIFNEPNLPRTADSITQYANTTVKALRDEGITKPIFFNISENNRKEQWEGVASSNIEGISFQWYPTGLVKYNELKGNFLPHVLNYPIPNLTNKIKDKAKIVYEFDAADIGESYMYPVMAHSFREAGMQWATMFCYDPTPLAQYNSEYSTHYLNLLYTPQKAISFLISSYIFNNGTLSKINIDSSTVVMGNVFTDYRHDLSLLNTKERYFYSNSNNISPVETENLKHIAGYGSSELIKYGGRGAYFLDKMDADLWKLEIFPDAVWLKDPFGRNGLDEPVAKLILKSHKMKIMLPELNSNFKIYPVNGDLKTAIDYSADFVPGVYFLTNDQNLSLKKNITDYVDSEMIKKYGEFISDFQSTEIKNITSETFYENEGKKIRVELYSSEEDFETYVYLKKPGWRSHQKFQLHKVDDFIYEFDLPKELSSNGLLEYFITTVKDREVLTFPGKLKVSPEYWSFNPKETFKLSILPSSEKVIIYDPQRDIKNLIVPNIWRYADFKVDYSFDNEFEEELNIDIRRVKDEYPELALQIFVGDYTKDIHPDHAELELEIKSISEELDSVFVRVLYDNSTGFERKILLPKNYGEIKIPLYKPEKFNFALLSRPYPTFLPYWYESNPSSDPMKNLKVESVQIAIRLPEPGKELNNYGIKIKKISLIKGIYE